MSAVIETTRTPAYIHKAGTIWRVIIPLPSITLERIPNPGPKDESTPKRTNRITTPVHIHDEHIIDSLLDANAQQRIRAAIQRLVAGTITPEGSFTIDFCFVDHHFWSHSEMKKSHVVRYF